MVGISARIDHVEPACRRREFAMCLQERLRGVHKFAALAGIDRRGAAAKVGTAPITHLDEHQGSAIATAVGRAAAIEHDQVKLTTTIGRIRRDFAQARA